MPPDRTPSIKRISLVRLRRDVTRTECLRLWFGPHADIVRTLPEVRRYTVAVNRERLPAPKTGWDAVATLEFDHEEDMACLAAPRVAVELARTRDAFAEAVEVMIVEEHSLLDGADAP